MILGIFSGVSTIEMVLCVFLWILSAVGAFVIFRDVVIQLIIMYKHGKKEDNN